MKKLLSLGILAGIAYAIYNALTTSKDSDSIKDAFDWDALEEELDLR
ncbi:MAG: hypothetical protein NT032_03730 [Actinobacteria bacterium]|nr:hypothetical protein [Actinomycetota bacterium]